MTVSPYTAACVSIANLQSTIVISYQVTVEVSWVENRPLYLTHIWFLSGLFLIPYTAFLPLQTPVLSTLACRLYCVIQTGAVKDSLKSNAPKGPTYTQTNPRLTPLLHTQR